MPRSSPRRAPAAAGVQHFPHARRVAVRKDGPVRHGHRDKTHVRPIRQFFDKVLQPDARP